MNIDSNQILLDSSNSHHLRCRVDSITNLAQDSNQRIADHSKSKFEFDQDFDQLDSQPDSKLSRIFENSVKSAK